MIMGCTPYYQPIIITHGLTPATSTFTLVDGLTIILQVVLGGQIIQTIFLYIIEYHNFVTLDRFQ